MLEFLSELEECCRIRRICVTGVELQDDSNVNNTCGWQANGDANTDLVIHPNTPTIYLGITT